MYQSASPPRHPEKSPRPSPSKQQQRRDITVMSQAFARRYADIAYRDILTAFGMTEEAARNISIDIGEAVVAKFTGEEWTNGRNPTEMVREEMIRRFGGEERIRKMIEIALEGKQIAVDAVTLMNGIRRRVLEEFFKDTLPITETLQSIVNRKVNEVFSGDESLDEDIDVKEGGGDGEEGEGGKSPKKSRVTGKNVETWWKRLRTSPNRQLRRTAALQGALNILQTSQEAREIVTELTETMLKTSFPPEMFNDVRHKGIALSPEQLNDASVNFLFWFIDHHPELKPINGEQTHHNKMIAYLRIFRGMDTQHITDLLTEYDEKKDDPPEIPKDLKEEDKIQWIKNWRQERTKHYAEIAESSTRTVSAVFARDKDVYVERFAKRARIADRDGRSVVKNLDTVAANVRKFMSKTPPSELSAHDIQTAYVLNMDYPQTSYRRTLEEVDVVLLQRGNLTARNRALTTIMRFIGKFVHNPYGQSVMRNTENSFEFTDMFQQAAEKVLEKLYVFNPRTSRITSYMGIWIKQVMGRMMTGDQLVRLTGPVVDNMRIIAQNPNASDDEILAIAKMKNKKISLKMIAHLRQMIGYGEGRYVSIDEQISGDDERAKGDVLPELSVTPDYEQAIDGDLAPKIAEAVFRTLSPRDAHILREIGLRGRTLEDVGAEMDLTRERVRQIKEGLIKYLLGEDTYSEEDQEAADDPTHPDHKIKERMVYYFVIKDERAFGEWLDQLCENKKDKKIIRLWCGVEEENSYKRLVPSGIRDYLGLQNTKHIKGLCERFMERVKKLQSARKKDQKVEEVTPFIYVSKVEAYREAAHLIKELDLETGYSVRPNKEKPSQNPA